MTKRHRLWHQQHRVSALQFNSQHRKNTMTDNSNFPTPEEYAKNRSGFNSGKLDFVNFKASEPVPKTDDRLKQQAEREASEHYAANRSDILSGRMNAVTSREMHERLVAAQAESVEEKRQAFQALLHKTANTTGEDRYTEKLNQLSQTLDENLGNESMTNRIMAQARWISEQRAKSE